MVFGWGKKKESKRVETIHQEKEIKFDEIPKIIEADKNLRQQTIIAEYDSFRQKINPQISELLKIVTQLEKDDLKVDDIDKILRIMVVRGKKQVISTIKKEAKSDFPKIDTYDQAEKLQKEINLMLKKIGDVLGRQSRVIHIFAKKYAARLKIILESLNSNRTEIQSIFENYKTKEEEAQQILENLEKFQNTKSKLSQRKIRVKEIQELKDKLNQKIETLIDQLTSLKDTDEYKRYESIKEKINGLSSEKSKIKHEIDEQFTKISRPLSKYVYVSSLDKEQIKLLENLTENPYEVIANHSKDDVIVILQAVRKGVQAGSVSVKDVEKSLYYIDETTEQLDDYCKKISEFLGHKKELEDQLSSFDKKEIDSMNLDLDRTKKELESENMRIESFESEIKDYEKLLPNIESLLETQLRNLTSTKYKIGP